jgi:hypothetical protein
MDVHLATTGMHSNAEEPSFVMTGPEAPLNPLSGYNGK